ncbi:MAG: T9SS type A sorting domain-containing protein, partial [Candidatus Kapaibacterium sp.]
STADSTRDTTRSFIKPIEGDDGWDDLFGFPGAAGIVYSVAVIDDDIYIGGRFNLIGNIAAYNVARWNRNSRRWYPLGEGVGGVVHALAVSGRDLYVGGIFETAGELTVNGIARWNTFSQRWSALDSGLQKVMFAERGFLPIIRGGDIYAIAVSGSDVYAAGDFDYVYKDRKIRHIARFDGSRWNALGTDTTGSIYGIAINGGDLYVGGAFKKIGSLTVNNIARWSIGESRWYPLGAGTDDTVHAVSFFNGELHAGGNFRTAGGVAAPYLARWDGTAWHAIPGGFDGIVYALTPFKNHLYVGGRFSTTSGLTANCIARWNGGSWSAMSAGMGLSINGMTQWVGNWTVGNGRLASTPIDEHDLNRGPETLPFVFAIAVAEDGEVYAGGHFTVAGNVSSHHIASWKDEAWHQLIADTTVATRSSNGTDGSVYAVAVSGDDIYIGGDFTVAGGVRSPRVARWNSIDNRWYPLGNGIDSAGSFVRSLAVIGSDLYAGGYFKSVSGVPARSLAKWNGTSWSEPGGGVGGDNPFVYALAAIGPDLYVGGSFTTAGSIVANGIARWSPGTSAWSALAGGVGGKTSSHYVLAITGSGSDIYVGGNFQLADTVPANNIARWDGTRWNPLIGGTLNGMNGIVTALHAHGALYAGGEFTRAGDAALSYLARWNGTKWDSPDPAAAGPGAPVYSITTDQSGSGIYVGGEFTKINGRTFGHVARVSSAGWEPVGVDSTNGGNGFARALAFAGKRLYIGGDFNITGGVLARHVASVVPVAIGVHGGDWSSLGADSQNGLYGKVLTMAVRGKDLYAAGYFSVVGGMRTAGIAHWNGERWLPVRGVMDGIIRAIAIDDRGGIYVGGEFTRVDSLQLNGLGYWDGTNWSAVGGGVAGALPYVYALSLSGNDLYVGGAFSQVAGRPARRLAHWNIAAGTWSGLGDVEGASYFTYVNSIAAYNGGIYVAGVFPGVSGVQAQNIARWDGSAWYDVGGGLNNAVYTIAVGPRGDLYAGGDFEAAGNILLRRFGHWDGTRWSNLGTFYDGVYSGSVYSIAVGDSDVYVGGSFLFIGNLITQYMARWDGRQWRNLGRGAFTDYRDGRVFAMAAQGNELFAGGDFTNCGGRSAFYLAHWTRQGIASVFQPAPVATADDGIALGPGSPNPASASTSITFRLQHTADITLTMFDSRGEALETLLSERREAGEHTVRWNSSRYPSGVYYCRLRSGGLTESQKIIVLGSR